jgi:hypothetical protein
VIEAFLYVIGAFLYVIEAFLYVIGAFLYVIEAFLYVIGAFLYVIGAFLYVIGAFLYVIGAFLYVIGAFSGHVQVWSMTGAQLVPPTAIQKLGAYKDNVDYFLCVNGHLHGMASLVSPSDSELSGDDQ